MEKKIVKKTKLKLFNLLLVLLILTGLFFGLYFTLQIPIKNIVIKGTSYLNDDYIIDLANIKDYPSFFLTRRSEMKKNLEKSKYSNKVKINKKYGFIILLNIDENKPIFYYTDNNNYIFNNGKEVGTDEISNLFRVPRVLNHIPDNKYNKFIKNMSGIKKDTINKISDIEYKPNDFDKDRFLLYMDDGNMVYLTLTKFKMINHYNDVLQQLEGHKGILYLDSGNHFKIKE